jgi:LysM repeat protein
MAATTYKVVKGDTLSAIAKRYGMTLAQLKKLNPQIINPNLIKVGQMVNVSATADTFTPTYLPNTETSGVTESTAVIGAPAGPNDAQNWARLEAESATAGLANATAFGLTKALIDMFPELKPIFDKFVAGDKTQAEIDYYATNYYKNMTDTAQQRATKKATRLGAYTQELEAYVVAQKARLVGVGITDENVLTNDFLEKAFLAGWTDKQLDLNALGGTTKPLTGGALGNTQSLKQYADAFGMSYNALTYDIWTKSLAAGTMVEDDIKAKMRQDSASSFPVFADQINAGKTLDSLASAYKSSIANILEKDPDTVSWTDPNLRKALQNLDKDGKPILMPIWQFEKNLRSTTEWEYTNNARDTMDALSLKVLRDWGLA